jgi:hypothetical protein
MVEDEDGRRVKGDDQCPGDQTDGVQEVHHLKGHQAGYNGKDEDTVTESSQRLVIGIPGGTFGGTFWGTFGPFLFSEENSIEEIDRSPHGAEPTTEEIAEEENEEENPESRKHSKDDLFLCEDRDDPDEWIEPKVEINRNFHFKGKSRAKDEIK